MGDTIGRSDPKKLLFLRIFGLQNRRELKVRETFCFLEQAL
jgi:hypothetical protein